jgi:hypothetical protein
MRARPLRITTTLVISAALSLASASVSGARANPVTVLRGNGLEGLHLGAHQPSAIKTLDQLFGRPTSRVIATPAIRNCGVDAQGSWHAMNAYFFGGRLVGLSFGPGRMPMVRTDAGLRLGDTLARARRLYARRLTTSGNNGGAWYIATPVGRIDGFLNPSGANAQRPTSIIATMGIGVVGCPAMSP